MKFGAIGQAGAMHKRLRGRGAELIARPMDRDAGEAFRALGAQLIEDYQSFLELMEDPRAYLMEMPPGAKIDELIDVAYKTMEPADVVVDASPSYWCDTLRRYRRMRHRAIYYVDIAWIHRDNQHLLIVGGDQQAVTQAQPLLQALSENYRHIGGPGLAHFSAAIEQCVRHAVKQVHNEAAMMLEAWPAQIDDDLMKQLWPLDEHAELGSAAWVLDDAVQLEASIPLLAQTIMTGISDALEDHRSVTPPPRVGPYQHPDEII